MRGIFSKRAAIKLIQQVFESFVFLRDEGDSGMRDQKYGLT